MIFSHRRFLICILTATSLIGFLSDESHAQDLDQASIVGLTVDTRGQPIANASIRTEPIGNGTTRLATTSSDGIFNLIELTPGKYRVRISASGFAEQTTDEIDVASSGTYRMKATLRPSDVSAELVIEMDNIKRIEIERVTLGDSILLRELLSFPTLSRDAIELIFQFTGVAEEGLGTRDLAEDTDSNYRDTPLEHGVASIGGGVSYSNNFTIDGMDNNDDRTSRERFSPPIDSLEEVQVITNQYSAEYGRASGGRVNFRTRSGSKLLRGSLGIRLRDERLNANSWRNKERFLERPRLRERKPSFTLGGPLGAGNERTFFFVAYEHSLLEDTTRIETFVPITQNLRFALPPPTSDEIFCEVADTGACATTVPTAAWMSPYQIELNTPDTSHTVNAKVDHRFVSGGDVSVGIQVVRKTGRKTAGESVTRFAESLQIRNLNSEAFNISYNRSIGSKTVVSMRAQWSRMTPGYRSENPDDPVILIAYRHPETNSSQTLVAGNSTASTLQNFSDTRVESRRQIQVGTTSVIGYSMLRFGVDLQNISSFAKALSDSSGTFNFSSFQTFGLGTLSRYRQNFGTDSKVINPYRGAYVMQDMRLADNLTLNLGMRYESEDAIRDRDNFGPRIGLAWDPIANGKSVARIGFGIFYNRVLLRTVADYVRAEREDLAFFDSNLIGSSGTDTRRVRVLAMIAQNFPSGFQTPDELRKVLRETNCAAGNIFESCSEKLGFADSSSSVPLRRVDEGIRIPRSVVWSASYELALNKTVFLEIAFSSNSTRNLWRERNINLPVIPEGYENWTGYLLANPFTFRNSNGNVRTYRFFLGDPRIGSGVSATPGGTSSCSTTANVTCHVNLNSFSSTSTKPSTTSANSGNSIGSPIGIAMSAINHLRPTADVGDISSISSMGFADSRALSFTIRSSRIGRDGFFISGRGSYSFGLQRDDGLNNTSNAEIDGDFVREYARSLSDRRHRIEISGILELPKYLGALQSSAAFRYGSSAPFNIGIDADRNLDGSSTDRPDYSGRPGELRWRGPGSDSPSKLLKEFSLPPIGSRSGNLPRNAGLGPSILIFDVGVSRHFRLNEKVVVRPTIEAGNVLNLTRFSFGAEYINFAAFGPSATSAQLLSLQNFLVPSRTSRPRDIRISLKIEVQ